MKEDNFEKHESDCRMSLSMIEQEEEAEIIKKDEYSIPEYHHFHEFKPIGVKPI